jgi:type IV secretion system protein VirD4
MVTFIYILEFIFNLLIDGVVGIADAFTKPKGFSAQFGRESMIASRWNRGFLISKNRRLSRRLSYQNLLLCSQTGGGKTVKVILKNLLLLRNCFAIINDPSGELYQKVSKYLSRYFNIIILNWSDHTVSCGYNFLDNIRKPNDINKIVHLLVADISKGNADPFWASAAKDALSIALRIVMLQPKEFRHMANVRMVLQHLSATPEKVDAWVAKVDAKLILDYKSLISNSPKTLQSILATAKACTQAWDDETVARITAHSSLDISQLRKKPTLIFLHTSVGDQKQFSGLTAMFFEQVFNTLLSKPKEKDDLPAYVFLEECSSLYIPLLPLFLANARKHCIGTLICLQTLSGQLKQMYGSDSSNIITNCVTKLFLAGQTEIEVLRELETLGGKTTYLDDKKGERVRSLISMDEIRQLKQNRSIIISSNKPLIKGRVSPYYRSLRFRAYTRLEPLSLKGDIPNTPIALMT